MATNKTRIKIRHGSTFPSTEPNGLLPYELGWDGTNLALYINNNGTIRKVGGEGLFLPLTGGTLSGPVINNFNNNSVGRHLTDLCHSYLGNSATGTIKITLPNTTSNMVMMVIRIILYTYNSDSGKELIISGYTYNNSTWYNYQATVLGGKMAQTIRLAYDGTHYCILLGATNTVWPFTSVQLADVYSSYGAQPTSGYSISLITSESGYTVTATVGHALVIGNGGTGATTATEAANNLLLGLPTWTANPNDDTYFIRRDTAGGDAFGQVKASTIYNYIAGKTTVSNTWTAGTTAGPTIKTTVNGVAGTAVAIPSASASASGIVTTGAQTFAGIKTFTSPETINTTGNGAQVNFKFSDAASANGIYGQNWITYENTSGRFYWREWSGSSSGRTSYYEQYRLPACNASRTSNATYTIITTKNPADLGYYLPLTGGTMTGSLTIQAAGDTYVWVKNTSTGNKVWLDAGGSANHGIWSDGYYNNSTFTSSGKWMIYRSSDGEAHTGMKLYGAVWNDYAEYRNTLEDSKPGQCVIENGDDSLRLSTSRMQRAAHIVSDTFGFAIGKTDKCKTPVAVSGRVLAYIYEGRQAARGAIGRPVCSGPNGTVSIMTDEEYKNFGYCAIGTISAVPDYEKWGEKDEEVDVNGRIWIKVY